MGTFTDAIYAAKFVSVIHMLKTPNFSTLICYDRIFCDITYTVTCCTENEAGRYGRFLAAMLETVMKWHAEREVFERECSGYPGFITKFRVTDKNSSGNETDTVDFENYRHVCHKWHYKIAKALVVCLESKDFVQIRNSLIVLTKIIQHFPVIQNLATVIEKRIEKVCEDEKDKRQDLYIKARSYQGQLVSRKSRMVKEGEFHLLKGKKEEEGEVPSSPAKADKDKNDKSGDGVEEGEIRSSSKEKKRERDRDSRSSRDSKERSTRDSVSRDREVRSSMSRERDHHRNGDMGPPRSDRSSVRRSQERDSVRRSQERDSSDRDIKRRRGGDGDRDRDKEREKEKSPVLDRLEKKEKLRKEREKEKLKKEKEEKEKEKESEKDSKKEKKRDS